MQIVVKYSMLMLMISSSIVIKKRCPMLGLWKWASLEHPTLGRWDLRQCHIHNLEAKYSVLHRAGTWERNEQAGVEGAGFVLSRRWDTLVPKGGWQGFLSLIPRVLENWKPPLRLSSTCIYLIWWEVFVGVSGPEWGKELAVCLMVRYQMITVVISVFPATQS